MKCFKCGTENNQGSVFCKSCGTRIDGKETCPKCKSLIEEENVFCTQCGARVDGKKACPVCNEVVDETTAFCPKCGSSLKKSKLVNKNDSTPSSQSGIKKIFKTIGFYFGLASVILCLIFTFCIGVEQFVSSGGTDFNI